MKWERLREIELKVIADCRSSGEVPGYTWTGSRRAPPLPFYSFIHQRHRCRVCGLPTEGRATWHCHCVTAYKLWTGPATHTRAILTRQRGLCAITGEPLTVIDANIDHRVPLYRVRRDFGARPWFELLPFWGLSNLQAISWREHSEKSAEEAAERREHRRKMT